MAHWWPTGPLVAHWWPTGARARERFRRKGLSLCSLHTCIDDLLCQQAAACKGNNADADLQGAAEECCLVSSAASQCLGVALMQTGTPIWRSEQRTGSTLMLVLTTSPALGRGMLFDLALPVRLFKAAPAAPPMKAPMADAAAVVPQGGPWPLSVVIVTSWMRLCSSGLALAGGGGTICTSWCACLRFVL